MDNGWQISADAWIADQGESGDFGRRYVPDPVMLPRAVAGSPKNALDVGCGEGRFCRMLKSRAVDAVGVDPTPALIAVAQARDGGGTYVQGTGERLPFREAAFDLVVSYLSLIDIADVEAAIPEMARVLRPGGSLLIANLTNFTTPCADVGWVKDDGGRRLYYPIDNYYAGNPRTVGQRVRVNGLVSTVVGVMPEGFGFPNQSALWQPLALRQDEDRDRRDNRNIDAFGRVAAGVTVTQAEADLALVLERLASDFPQTNAGIAPLVRPYRDLTTSGPIRVVFTGLMGSVVFLLLIACANVANLLLARGAARAREITLRVSLGATRRQVIRQLLAEGLLLALVAGALGLALAAVGVRLVQLSIAGTGEPYWLRFPIEGSVFASVAAICLGTTVLCGLAPALHSSKLGLSGVLSEAGRSTAGAVGTRRWTDGFVVLQIALSLTMLAGQA